MKKTAFLSEPRKHKALKFVLENFLSILPEEWYVQVNHGTHNINYIKSIVDESEIISNANSNGRFLLYNLGVENMTHEGESNLLRTEAFWDNVDGDLLLKFECDTMLCPNSEYKIRVLSMLETKLVILSSLISKITPLSFIFEIASKNFRNSLLFSTLSSFSII